MEKSMNPAHPALVKLAVVLLLMLSSVSFAVQPGNLTDMDGALLPDRHDPFLGIWGGSFSRWENGIVPIAYNHEGAPSEITIDDMEARLKAAFSIIENIAGIYFVQTLCIEPYTVIIRSHASTPEHPANHLRLPRISPSPGRSH
jgi:hypothetical protein